MKDKNKRLWWHDRLSIGLLLGMLLTAVLAKANPGPVFLVLALVLLIAFGGVELFMNRCPHCDRFLGRDWGRFCRHCGGRVREDKTDT